MLIACIISCVKNIQRVEVVLVSFMLSISIVGTVGVPACYGGFESLVDNLLDHTPPSVRYTVFCSSKTYPTPLESYKGARLEYVGLNANGISSIPYDIISLWKSRRADIVLILGVSGCLFLPIFRLFCSGRIITNIDGLEWRREKWSGLARFILRASERMAARFSDVVVADNRGIVDHVLSAYGRTARLIAYGGDHAIPVEDDSLYERYPFCRKPYAVSVCRIEPENNIHHILDAFSKMPDNRLVLVGNWSRSPYGQGLRSQFSGYGNIHLLDPIYEPHAINWLRSNAALYVHGHSAGGTNPSLVEAMCLGLPILAFDCVYNRATTEGGCLYWKDAKDLEGLLSTPGEKLEEMGAVMLEKGQALYAWERIASQYHELY